MKEHEPHPVENKSTNISPMSNVIWQAVAPAMQIADSLVSQAYEVLWKQIVEGELQPGERLIPSELARILGVSRTPVQLALYQLCQAGLVDTTGGRGFHVAIINSTDIRDLYDLRCILETAAIQAAIDRIPITALETALAQTILLQHTSGQEQSLQFLYSDVQLHNEIIAIHTNNRRLIEAIAHQRARMSLFTIYGMQQPNSIDIALIEHNTIIEALIERNSAKAIKAMEQHIQRAKEDALRYTSTMKPARIRRFHNP